MGGGTTDTDFWWGEELSNGGTTDTTLVGHPQNPTLSPTQTQTLHVSPASQSDSDSDPIRAREQSVRLLDPV